MNMAGWHADEPELQLPVVASAATLPGRVKTSVVQTYRLVDICMVELGSLVAGSG